MPVSLLDSQLSTLEPLGVDEHAITVETVRPREEIVDEVLRELPEAG